MLNKIVSYTFFTIDFDIFRSFSLLITTNTVYPSQSHKTTRTLRLCKGFFSSFGTALADYFINNPMSHQFEL